MSVRNTLYTECLSCMISVLIVAIVLVTSGTEVRASDDDGAPGKLRIMVDKTYREFNEELPLTEEQVGKIADAGFNVVVPRKGASDLSYLEKAAGWADDHDISFMPWMRGYKPPGDGPKMVWADGTVTPITSPLSDHLWDWLTRRMTSYAKISTRVDSFMGVFLDYEIYQNPKNGNAFSLSYDQRTLQKFAEAQDVDLPSLDPGERKQWLQEQGIHGEFSKYQVQRWRTRCRRLREKVDNINPSFQFCVYPAPGTPFMRQAVYPEWSSEQAPIILADHSGYGRRGAIPHSLALQQNRQAFLRNRREVASRDFPHRYIGGIDPKVEGADPEFSGKNALMQAQASDGYWVFYEGPTQSSWQDRRVYFTPGPEDHEAYMKWFRWANRHIENGTLDAWEEPRETRDPILTPAAGVELTPTNEKGAQWTPSRLEKPGTHLRGSGTYFFRAKQDQPISLYLRGHQLGNYPDQPVYLIRDVRGRELKRGRIPLGELVKVQFQPEEDGIYQLITFSRSNSASARIGAPHWVMVPPGFPDAKKGMSISNHARRLFFHVPEGTEEFTVVMQTPDSDAEQVDARVLNPQGQTVANGHSARTLTLDVTVPQSKRGRAWSLVIEEPEHGVFEDVELRLDGIPTLFSESPEALMVPE